MRVRRGMTISVNQFRIMLGCSSTEAIDLVRRLMYMDRKKTSMADKVMEARLR